jgi:hypothetical protein
MKIAQRKIRYLNNEQDRQFERKYYYKISTQALQSTQEKKKSNFLYAIFFFPSGLKRKDGY